MIVITVGTEKYPFNRLMLWIDILIKNGFISTEKEEVIVQYGNCTIIPAGVKAYRLLPETEFQNILEQARYIIAHCGEGTIGVLTQIETPFIIVPRSYSFGEHVDDHQIELAQALAQRNVPVAYCPGDLVRFIHSPVTPPSLATLEAAMNNLCKLLESRFPALLN